MYYIYEIKNNINGKIYIGAHETANLDDNYMGSGHLIKRAIKRYGKENFSKTILEFFSTREEMYNREQQIITSGFLLREDVYNIALGGCGGSMKQNQKPFKQKHSQQSKDLISQNTYLRRISKEKREEMKLTHWSKTRPEEQREHAKYAASCRTAWNPHSDEVKHKISETLKQRNKIMKQNNTPHPNVGIVRIKIICPFCHKQGAANVMKRFHFNNCKHNLSLDKSNL